MTDKKDEGLKMNPVKESMNIDEIAANSPNEYAIKLTPKGRDMILAYLNSRPMSQVEQFFNNMFDIEDKDPFFSVVWIKKLVDYLRDVCPRGEARPIVMGLANHMVLFKIDKPDDKKDKSSNKKDEKIDKPDDKKDKK